MLDKMPPRQRQLNHIYRDKGGIRAEFVRLYNEGLTVEKIAEQFSRDLGKPLPVVTLYQWSQKWRQEAQEQDGKDLVTA